jgi:hypothetical protein
MLDLRLIKPLQYIIDLLHNILPDNLHFVQIRLQVILLYIRNLSMLFRLHLQIS